MVGVQECIDDVFFEKIDQFLSPHGYVRVLIPNDRVKGRGDGSFIFTKYTGLALYIRLSLRSTIQPVKSVSCPLGMTEGSKGVACLLLRIYSTTVVFMCTHMPSSSIHARNEAYYTLVEKTGNLLGDEYFQLLEQFHHIVWFGDFNFRSHNLSGEEALVHLKAGDTKKLKQYDELEEEVKAGRMFYRFCEPRMAPNFYPTYKKIETRPIPVDRGDPLWAEQQYRIWYTEPWYKKGKTVARVPSYCDRVLYHSLDDCGSSIVPEAICCPEHDNGNDGGGDDENTSNNVETGDVGHNDNNDDGSDDDDNNYDNDNDDKDDSERKIDPPSTEAQNIQANAKTTASKERCSKCFDNYGVVENLLSSSDHSAIFCGLTLKIRYTPPPRRTYGCSTLCEDVVLRCVHVLPSAFGGRFRVSVFHSHTYINFHIYLFHVRNSSMFSFLSINLHLYPFIRTCSVGLEREAVVRGADAAGVCVSQV